MIRLLLYLVIVLALSFGFSWIANRPGIVTLSWQGMEIQTSLMVVIAGIISLVAIVLLIWGLLKNLLGLPSLLSRFFFNRRRDRGYEALSKGLIAIGAGDANLARRMSTKSARLLSSDPLVQLLSVQTVLLEGNHKTAQEHFQSMLKDDATKLLGLRGLYLEAEREGAREAASQYADEASDISPSIAWVGNARLRNFSMAGDWEKALATLEVNLSSGLIDKVLARRQRAVLLTARAIAEEPANPVLSASLAIKAHRLAPDLVPAAVIGATALARCNRLRKAARMLEATWKLFPHPELADTYVNLRMGDSAVDRLKRARKLEKLQPDHPESNMTVACAAIDAKDWETSRKAMKSVLIDFPGKRACLVMAEIEEKQHGDSGRTQEWLSRAVRAPGDAQWIADGHVSDIWFPVSPITGKIDAFDWKVPVEHLQENGKAIEAEDFNASLKTPSKDKITASSDQYGEGIETSEKTGNQKSSEPDHIREENGNLTFRQSETTKTEEQASISGNDARQLANSSQESGERKKDRKKSLETLFPLPRRPDDPGIKKED